MVGEALRQVSATPSTWTPAPPRLASSTPRHRLALQYNDALDRCTQSGATNIDELMNLFAEDAVRIHVGGEVSIGKPAIREHFLARTRRLRQVCEVRSIELWGDLVFCRLERRDSTHARPGVEHNLRIMDVKEGKIVRLIVVTDPAEVRSLRTPGSN